MTNQTQHISLEQAFQLAIQRQSAGELAAARAIYEKILRAEPGHPESLTMWASTLYRMGEDEQAATGVDGAIDSYRNELAAMPNNDAVRASMVNLLLARGRVAEAEAAVGKVSLPLQPRRDTPEAFEMRRRQAQQNDLPVILINALPKSASESIWNKLANGLGMAQCHMTVGLFPDCCVIPDRARQVGRGGIAGKEHIAPTDHNVKALAAAGIDRLVVHFRDPRQALLSWAHFVSGDVGQRLLAPLWRKTVPPASVLTQPVEAQLPWYVEHYLPHQVAFIDRWVAMADDPGCPLNVKPMTFEAFLTDPDSYFSDILAFYGLDAARFAADAESETVHMRRGAADEWRDVYDEPLRDRAWQAIPRSLADRYNWTR